MLQSILFRVLLIAYSLAIVRHCNGFLTEQICYIVSVVYFICYLFLKKREWSMMRLIIDFAYINLVVFDREINHPLTFLFILLPLINAINFSGKNNHSSLLMILVTSTLLINMHPLEKWILYPIFTLWGIYILAWIKYREWSVVKNITTHIDTYFINKEQIEKPHKIYNNIIRDLNNFFFR